MEYFQSDIAFFHVLIMSDLRWTIYQVLLFSNLYKNFNETSDQFIISSLRKHYRAVYKLLIAEICNEIKVCACL